MPYKIDKVIASSFEILNSPNPTTKIVSLIPQPDIDIGKITNKFVMQITERNGSQFISICIEKAKLAKANPEKRCIIKDSIINLIPIMFDKLNFLRSIENFETYS